MNNQPDLTNKVIQIAPPHKWVGCFAVVEESKPWGVQAGVPVPDGRIAYIRLVWGEFEVIGDAAYVEDKG